MSAQISLSSISHMATPKFKGAGKYNTSMNLDGEENGQATLCLWYLEEFQISHGAEEQFVACYWLQTWAPITACYTASEFPGSNDNLLTYLQPRPVFSYLWMNFVNLELILIVGTMDKLHCLLVDLFITLVLWWLIKQLSQKTLHTIHSTWKVLTEEPNINTKFFVFSITTVVCQHGTHSFSKWESFTQGFWSHPDHGIIPVVLYGFSMNFLSFSEPHGN